MNYMDTHIVLSRNMTVQMGTWFQTNCFLFLSLKLLQNFIEIEHI